MSTTDAADLQKKLARVSVVELLVQEPARLERILDFPQWEFQMH
jgi:hypothetical protein